MKSNYRPLIFLGSIVPIILITYLWQVSFGQWEKWPKTTDFYNLQAEAFLQGQTSLLVEPDPSLIGLSDPYEMSLRNASGARSIFDLTFYKGKYYLYWGPVPAILILPFKSFYAGEIGDHQITFWLLTAMLIVNCMLAFRIWRDHFLALPIWHFLLGVVILGTINPIPWLLHRARVYQTAISSGQFFLLCAIALIYFAFRQRPSSMIKLILASLCLSLAIGSRFILLPSALCILVLIVIQPNGLKGKFDRRSIILLLLPMMITLGALGWYNKIRFDSFTEFGLTYQINEVNYTKKPAIFSPAYLPANIYNYIFLPFHVIPKFPYITADGAIKNKVFGFTIPKTYAPAAVSGILPTTPFIIMAVIPLYALITKRIHDEKLKWLILYLSAALFPAMGVVFLYFIPAMRFLMDFMPSLALLAVIGFWQGCIMLQNKPFELPFKIIGILTAISTVLVSMIIAMSNISRVPVFVLPKLLEKILAKLLLFLR